MPPSVGSPRGTCSRQGLAALLAGKYLSIEDQKTHRWGRTIAVVWVTTPDCT